MKLYREKYHRESSLPSRHYSKPSRDPRPEVELRGSLTRERERNSTPHPIPEEVQFSDAHSMPSTLPLSAIPGERRELTQRLPAAGSLRGGAAREAEETRDWPD